MALQLINFCQNIKRHTLKVISQKIHITNFPNTSLKGSCKPVSHIVGQLRVLQKAADIRARTKLLHGPSMFAAGAKIYGVSIINPAPSLLIKHLVIGQRQKAPNFSAFHWSVFRNHEDSTFTEKDRNKLNYRIGPKRT